MKSTQSTIYLINLRYFIISLSYKPFVPKIRIKQNQLNIDFYIG